MTKLARIDPDTAPGMLSVERARAWLAQAVAVDEVKSLRDKAAAIAAYQRKQKSGREAAIDADKIVVYSDRKIGQLIDQLPKQETPIPKGSKRGGERGKLLTARAAGNRKSALADLGIGEREASRYRASAELPDADFDTAVEREAKKGRVTTRRITEPRRRAKRNAKLAAAAEVVTADAGKRCAVLLTDPPWRYEHCEDEDGRAIEKNYPTLPLEDICGWNIDELLIDDAVVFMWATSPKLGEAFEVLKAWGLSYRTCMVWVKDKIGMGYYARQRHELLLLATRGSVPCPAPSDRPDSVIEAKRGAHSAKPDAVYGIIERMYPDLPKGELFARKGRQGWLAWGNEA